MRLEVTRQLIFMLVTIMHLSQFHVEITHLLIAVIVHSLLGGDLKVWLDGALCSLLAVVTLDSQARALAFGLRLKRVSEEAKHALKRRSVTVDEECRMNVPWLVHLAHSWEVQFGSAIDPATLQHAECYINDYLVDYGSKRPCLSSIQLQGFLKVVGHRLFPVHTASIMGIARLDFTFVRD